ncbi:MAG: hypothetical protein AAF443_02390 [Chlamydiota bacterium]
MQQKIEANYLWWTLIAIALFSAQPLFGAVEGRYFHYFALEADYVLLRRANNHDKSLVVVPSSAGSSATDTTMISSANLVNDMPFKSGFSAALKIFYGLRSTWEFRYLGRFHWRGEKEVTSVQSLLTLPGGFGADTVDYAAAQHARGVYSSNMYTSEVNYWRHATPRYTDHFSVSWLMGLRFFNIEEKLKLSFATGNSASRYRVKTRSRSFGLQAGFSLEYNPYRVLTWGGVAKVGALFNRGRQSTLLLDNNNTVALLQGAASRSDFAYCAQVYPFIEWRPTKSFDIIVHYQVLYIGGIAVADSQLFFDEGGEIRFSSNGDIIYHGLTAAIHFNF